MEKRIHCWIRVNNGEQLDVMPLVGDFNFMAAFIGMYICC